MRCYGLRGLPGGRECAYHRLQGGKAKLEGIDEAYAVENPAILEIFREEDLATTAFSGCPEQSVKEGQVVILLRVDRNVKVFHAGWNYLEGSFVVLKDSGYLRGWNQPFAQNDAGEFIQGLEHQRLPHSRSAQEQPGCERMFISLARVNCVDKDVGVEGEPIGHGHRVLHD